MKTKTCGDKVTCGTDTVTCTREKDHPMVGFNDKPGFRGPFSFHEGDGWVWDARCGWKKGEEPGVT